MSYSNCFIINLTPSGGLLHLCPSVSPHIVSQPICPLDPAVYYAHLAGNSARVLDQTPDDDDRTSTTTGGTNATQLVIPLKAMHGKFAGGAHAMWFL